MRGFERAARGGLCVGIWALGRLGGWWRDRFEALVNHGKDGWKAGASGKCHRSPHPRIKHAESSNPIPIKGREICWGTEDSGLASLGHSPPWLDGWQLGQYHVLRLRTRNNWTSVEHRGHAKPGARGIVHGARAVGGSGHSASRAAA